MSELTAQGEDGPMSDYRKLEERLRNRHLLGDCVLAAGVIKALREDNERLRRDAERYRWICRFPEDADYAITHALNGCDGTGDGPSFRDLLSDAIDAALAAKGET